MQTAAPRTLTVYGRVPKDVYDWLIEVARAEAARTGTEATLGMGVRTVLMDAYRRNGKKGK